MDSTLHDLGNLLVQAIPTILFFVLLTVFLNAMLFKPLGRVLEERRKATEGVRELAQKAFEAADRKGAEFEKALQMARAEMHAQHEELRRKWVEEQEAELAKARAAAEEAIQRGRHEIEAETQRALAELDGEIQVLSERIVNSLLRKRAA
jgi:F-type H+-transporting ATPase subunit b